MALITTAGSATADSYATLAQASTYHTAQNNAAWAAADTTSQEAALRRATLWIDATYRSRWIGERVNGRSQSLDWPRYGVTDVDGWAVDYATIPAEIVSATCDAAVREVVTPFCLTPDVVMGREKVLTGVKGITWEPLRKAGSAADLIPVLTAVEGLLGRLISTTSQAVTTTLLRA
jgi:hypothetical protein